MTYIVRGGVKVWKLSAVWCRWRYFKNKAIPQCNSTSEASRVAGITYCQGSSILYLHGKVVNGELIREAPLNLIALLQSKKNPVSIGHTIKKMIYMFYLTDKRGLIILNVLQNSQRIHWHPSVVSKSYTSSGIK